MNASHTGGHRDQWIETNWRRSEHTAGWTGALLHHYGSGRENLRRGGPECVSTVPGSPGSGRVISNWTGRWVFRWTIDARLEIRPNDATSRTLMATRSHPRNLLSMARLNRARFLGLLASCRRHRMPHTSRSLSGRFWPTSTPWFQGGDCSVMRARF